MPIRSAFVTRFFQLVTVRRFAEAERVLERAKIKRHKTQWNTGYFNALEGLLSAARMSSDRYVFLSKLDLNNKDKLRGYRREFLKNARRPLHADFDRGFFSAWADYMRVLLKMDSQKTEQPN